MTGERGGAVFARLHGEISPETVGEGQRVEAEGIRERREWRVRGFTGRGRTVAKEGVASWRGRRLLFFLEKMSK